MDLEARLAGLLPSRRWRALVSRAWRLSAPLREIAAGVLGEPVAAAPAAVREVHLPMVTATRPAPPARPRFDPIKHPPSWMPLAMSTSNLCNYRCRHCHIWMQRDPLSRLTTAQRVDLIRQFAALNPEGNIAIPGGEVMMDMPELLALAGACKGHGIRCYITSNGSYVVDEEIARTVAESGITQVCISLDSHVPEIHRYTRGVVTAYEETLRAIKLLVAARDRRNPQFRVTVACVVFDRNLKLLPEWVAFCRELGVNQVDFQLLGRTFSNQHPSRDVFFEKHFFHTPEAKAEALTLLTQLIDGHKDGFLVKSRDDLVWISKYLESPDFTTDEPICGSHEKNLVVNADGNVALCYNSHDVLPRDPWVGNAADVPLAGLWSGPRAQAARAAMDACTLGCGQLNCHRRGEE